MPQLDLPRGPRELFQAVHRPLARAFGGDEHICFGGGTALAARCAHRHSVDVDLFVGHDPYLHFQRNTGARFTLDLTASASVSRLAIGRDDTYISFHGLDGHITINPGAETFDPRSPDTVRGTNLPFETTTEIIAKKLVYRMARDKRIISQDLYDIAWTDRHDPSALDQAFRAVRYKEFTDIAVALDDHAASGRELIPLLAPADPRLEKDAPAIVRQLVHRQLRHRDPGPDLTSGPVPGR